MRTGFTLLFVLFSLLSCAQVNDTASVSNAKKETTQNFKDQEEKESRLAEKIFEQSYNRETYELFNDKIVTKGNSYRFGKKVIELTSSASNLKAAFAKGMLYPQFLAENLLSVQDTLVVSAFEELKSMNASATRKRFRFCCSAKGSLMPAVYLIEFTNEKATTKTSIEAFIAGSKLTFFTEGWVTI